MNGRKPVLAVLAAGMGSRYGGLKQIDPIGPHGEIILHYSIYDAWKAGFEKAVFIIRREFLDDFEKTVGSFARRYMDVEYTFQDIRDLPEGAEIPEGRVKPWGTGHAILTMRDMPPAPFGVINSDDFYGRETFDQLYRFLKTAEDTDTYQYCMIGYRLKNTLTENGTVSRGICRVKNDVLQKITERTGIERADGAIRCLDDDGKTLELDPEDIVSLNIWGFTPSIMRELREGFGSFCKGPWTDPLKAEYYLPTAVDELIRQGKATVHVIPSQENWYGVTYREDRDRVTRALTEMHNCGVYPDLIASGK